MRKPLAIGAATLAVVLSLGLAACGSSDDSSDNEDMLTKSELVSKADAICTQFNDKLFNLQDDSGITEKSSDDKKAAFISNKIVPLYEDQVDQLRSLQPNGDDAETYTDLVDTLESELKTVADDPKGALQESNPFEGASKKAQDFGLKVCGSN